MVKGIVQKSFLPTAKEFFFDDFDENESHDVSDKIENKNISKEIGLPNHKLALIKVPLLREIITNEEGI